MPPSLLAAFRFLTILPVPAPADNQDTALAESLRFFPLVGLGIGVIAAFAAFIFWNIFPAPVSAVLVVTLLVVISGGLHMDGLADTADGFFSCRSRERILVIMRDSRIGAMGVMSVVLILALKITALGSMERGTAIRAALLMPVAGRTAILLLMAFLKYVRSDGGLGTLFYTTGKRKKYGFFAVITFVIFSFIVTGSTGWIIVPGILITISIFSGTCQRKIGGVTGDTLGAGSELAETVVVLLLSLH